MVLLVVVLGACSSSGVVAAGPKYPAAFSPVGRGAVPARPLMLSQLPAGTRIGPRLWPPGSASPENTQFLYMPKSSTPGSGPALVVGFVGDDEAPPSYCLPKTSDEKPTADPSWLLSNASYVFGRDVSDADLRRASRTVAWGDEGHAPSLKIPAGFSLRASSDLPAFAVPSAATFSIGNASGRGVLVGQTQYNTAGVFVADFWRHVLDHGRCRDRIQETILRGGTVVRLLADNTAKGRSKITEVRRHLRRGSRAEFCANQCSA